jgi:hypothetical protein
MGTCGGCGAECANPKFCSNACQARARWHRQLSAIEACGQIIGGSRRLAKRYLLHTYGWRCSLCSGERWRDAEIPLLLDHINGNAEDWALTNLRLICPNCDAQLPTFKSRNRGKGRAWRRLRYAAGKSY